MTKRRISQQQQNRIETMQQKRRTGASQQGTVIAHYGKFTTIKSNNTLYQCKIRQNLGDIVVGDVVVFQLNQQNEAVIDAILSRNTKFYRLDERGQEKLIAANINQVFVVMAPTPEPSWLLLDSYLAAINHLKISATIIFNKIDLAKQEYEDYWQLYYSLNIPVIKTSVVDKVGLDALKQALKQHCSVFVGQSGVGKSSLIQSLLPQEALVVGDLHEATGLGTHTTSTARLYELPGEASIIDSPGVRDFNLWPMSAMELATTFVEFRNYLGRCKFRDCSHSHEPECALRQAFEQEKIASSRWDNYHTLLQRFNNKP